MITKQLIDSLDHLEGDFLFILEDDLTPAISTYNLMLKQGSKKRNLRFICTESSTLFNNLTDLSNNVKNYLKKDSYIGKGEISYVLDSFNLSNYALVYIDLPMDHACGPILEHLHSKILTKARIVSNNVGDKTINDYIIKYRLNKPNIIDESYSTWLDVFEPKVFNRQVVRTRSTLT